MRNAAVSSGTCHRSVVMLVHDANARMLPEQLQPGRTGSHG